jgi:hypothetical protein
MVQVINLGPTKSALQADVLQNTLGRALNEGLGKFTTNMFINKKMTEMENDKELMAKPLSDRLSAAQKALAPWGEDGKQYFQQRMQLEQQREQEKSRKSESRLVQKLLKGEELTDKELENARPELQIAAFKARQPKAAPGGVTAQPVPPEVANKISFLIKENPNASSDELAVKFAEEGVPDIFSNKFVENRRRQEETQAKTGQKGLELERTYQTGRAAPILKKYDEIAANLPFKESALNTIEQNMTDTGITDFIADITGIEPFRSASASRAKTGLKEYLLSNLVRAGARPNQWIEQQINSALPNFGRSPEANESVTRILRNQYDIEKAKTDLIFDLAKQDRAKFGYEHGDLEERANQQLKPIIEKYNDNLSYDLRKIYENYESDKELLKVKKVPKGTPLTVKMAALLLINTMVIKRKQSKKQICEVL